MKQKKPVAKPLILLIVLSLFLLGGCQKTKEPKEVVDEYLKKAQQNPQTMTNVISSMNRNYLQQIEDLMKDFEYELQETEDMESDESGSERKSVLVTFTGYDIGAYFRKYLENYQSDVLWLLGQDHSYEELAEMIEKDPEKYKELYSAADLEIFTKYMNECREAGKTYHTEKRQYGIVVWKDKDSKEWKTNPLAVRYHLDWITNGVYTDYQNYKKSISGE
ncbi:MAG: hypothetical protein J5589_10255 [Firmicutes bacterium]|nr:hypothetical protein [Bacillota bacterium]